MTIALTRRALLRQPGRWFLIGDGHSRCLRRVAIAHTITTVAGSGVAGYRGEGGPATAAQLRRPVALAAMPIEGF
jgi:hypothetical protein